MKTITYPYYTKRENSKGELISVSKIIDDRMAILVFPLKTSPEIRHIMPDSALYNSQAESNRLEFLNAYGKTIEILNEIAAI